MQRTLVLTLLLTLLSLPALAGNRVEICHVTGSGSINTLSINENAVPAHLNHGDYLPVTFYADADGDGYGDSSSSVEACEADPGDVEDNTDCDDTDAATNPGAEEIMGDGIDNDCNPATPDENPVVCPCNRNGNRWTLLFSGAVQNGDTITGCGVPQLGGLALFSAQTNPSFGYVSITKISLPFPPFEINTCSMGNTSVGFEGTDEAEACRQDIVFFAEEVFGLSCD